MTNLEKHERLYSEVSQMLESRGNELPSVEDKGAIIDEIAAIVQRALEEERFPILYRYSVANCDNICPILNESLYLPTADHMNDKLEGRVVNAGDPDYDYIPQLKKFQKKTLIKSFSVLKSDSTMWKEYGDHNKGMCVTYDFSKLKPRTGTLQMNILTNHLYPVLYNNAAFTCQDRENLQNNPYFYLRKRERGDIVGHPDYPFKDEKEWRLVYVLERVPNPSDLKHYKSVKNCITEVCFGAEICPVRREQIIEEICSHHLNVRLFQARKVGDLIEREEIPLPKSDR